MTAGRKTAELQKKPSGRTREGQLGKSIACAPHSVGVVCWPTRSRRPQGNLSHGRHAPGHAKGIRRRIPLLSKVSQNDRLVRQPRPRPVCWFHHLRLDLLGGDHGREAGQPRRRCDVALLRSGRQRKQAVRRDGRNGGSRRLYPACPADVSGRSGAPRDSTTPQRTEPHVPVSAPPASGSSHDESPGE